MGQISVTSTAVPVRDSSLWNGACAASRRSDSSGVSSGGGEGAEMHWLSPWEPTNSSNAFPGILCHTEREHCNAVL